MSLVHAAKSSKNDQVGHYIYPSLATSKYVWLFTSTCNPRLASVFINILYVRKPLLYHCGEMKLPWIPQRS